MTILISSDWHLNDKPRDRYRHDWVRNELPRLIDKHEVATLLMLGDMTDEFDNHPASLVNEVIDHLTCINMSDCVVCGGGGFSSPGTGYNNVCDECGGQRQRPVSIYLMRGNHDYVDPNCPFFKFTAAIPRVTWINEPRLIEIDGTRMLFLPHTRDYKKDWADVDFSKADICFAHNTFDGTISESGMQLEGIPPSAIPEDLPVISGDIHKRQDVKHITYVGSPYTIDFGDSYKPRVLVLTDGKVKSIACSGAQKRLIVTDIGKDQAFKCLDGLGDDIVKLRVTVSKNEQENWPTIKRQIAEEAIKRGVRLHAIEAVMDGPTSTSKRYKAPTDKPRRDDEVVTAYCKSRKVADELLEVGLEIVKDKGG